MKLAYLHPRFFNIDFKRSVNKNFLIRLSKLDAHHDKGIEGLSWEIIDKIIIVLKHFGDVKIISERKVPDSLQEYLLDINPNNLHRYLSHCSLLISDSQSMTMEAAMLGIPSIRFSSFVGKIGVLEELELKYHLTFGISPKHPNKLFETLNELLESEKFEEIFEERRKKMLEDKIDVTSFFVWLIENYPKSINDFKADPSLQFKFK